MSQGAVGYISAFQILSKMIGRKKQQDIIIKDILIKEGLNPFYMWRTAVVL